MNLTKLILQKIKIYGRVLHKIPSLPVNSFNLIYQIWPCIGKKAQKVDFENSKVPFYSKIVLKNSSSNAIFL